MAKQRIDGYEVPVYHFDTKEDRSKFLEQWIEDHYDPMDMWEDKCTYMGRDAVFIGIGPDTKIVATI